MHHLLEHINQDIKRRYSKDKDSTGNKTEYLSKRNPTGKPWLAWQQPKLQAPTISSIDMTPYNKLAKFYTNCCGHTTKMAYIPIYGINPLKSSPEPDGWWLWDLACIIWDLRPTKFIQMMILCWPWSTYLKSWFLNTVEAKVTILTWNVKPNETMAINKFQRSRLTFQPMSLILASHQYIYITRKWTADFVYYAKSPYFPINSHTFVTNVAWHPTSMPVKHQCVCRLQQWLKMHLKIVKILSFIVQSKTKQEWVMDKVIWKKDNLKKKIHICLMGSVACADPEGRDRGLGPPHPAISQLLKIYWFL